jgi:hypothetical protein
LEVRIVKELTMGGWTKGERILVRGGTPPVICKKVRKSLIVEELVKYSFLKSAQEYESNGFMISLFLRKTERVKQEGELTEQTVSTRKE